jgi:hypothetical protein
MDKTAKQHYALIITSLLICIFLYVDTYLIPFSHAVETVKDFRVYRSNGYRGRSDHRTYTLKTNVGEYDIPESFFDRINKDIIIGIDKSYLTGSIQMLYVDAGEGTYIYEAGFLRAGFGKIYVPLVIIGSITMLLCFRIIDNVKGRGNLSFAVFICSILLLLAYIDLHII